MKNKKQRQSRYTLALEIIDECKAFLLSNNISSIETKSEGQLVTNIDLQLNTLIIKRISENYDDNIVGEEESKSTDSLNNWYVDPIDGTTNFIYRKQDYAISIGYEGEEGKFGVVYDVTADVLYHGSSDLGVFINDSPLIRPVTPEYGIIFVSNKDLQDKKVQNFAKRFQGIRDLQVCALECLEVVKGNASCFYRTEQDLWDYKGAVTLAELTGVPVEIRNEKTVLVGTQFI